MFVVRIYGLQGCPSCQQAVNFAQSKGFPFEAIIANGDPIIVAGNKAMNNGEDKYPILICNLTKDIVVGFKQEEYERIFAAVAAFYGGSSWNVSNSPEQSNGENPTPPAQTVAGAN